jgi:hypothetical protein
MVLRRGSRGVQSMFEARPRLEAGFEPRFDPRFDASGMAAGQLGRVNHGDL